MSKANNAWDYADELLTTLKFGSDDELLADIHSRPEYDRNLLAVHICQGEWNNGGLHQFFLNSSGVLAPEAASAHEAIGMPRVATLLRQGMKIVGEPLPRRQEEIENRLSAISPDAFDDLDNQFFKANSDADLNIDQAMERYYRAKTKAP